MRLFGAAVGIAAFVALLVLATLRGQAVECEVCIEGARGLHCARAAAEDRETALAGALSTACGTAAGAMDAELACRGRPPHSAHCEP